jgi:hypothetical protein
MPAAVGVLMYDTGRALLRAGKGKRGTMTTSTENSPIYSEAISGWMATHQGRMPGVVPTSSEPGDDIVVDTPCLDDAAKKRHLPLRSQPWRLPEEVAVGSDDPRAQAILEEGEERTDPSRSTDTCSQFDLVRVGVRHPAGRGVTGPKL